MIRKVKSEELINGSMKSTGERVVKKGLS